LQLHNAPFQTYIDEAELQIADSWQTKNNVKCLLMTFRSTLDRRFKRLTSKLKVEDQRNVEINLRWAGHNGGLLGGHRRLKGGHPGPRGDFDAGLTQVKAAVGFRGSLALTNNNYRTWTVQYFDGQVLHIPSNANAKDIR
jgi:hypothetical protein